jgi:hypothetical protein
MDPKNSKLENAKILNAMEASIVYFMAQMWGLVPQPVKESYATRWQLGLLLKHNDWNTFVKTITKDWFEPYQDGLHMTWQQALILYGVDKGLKGECSNRLSVVSGHGCHAKGTKILMSNGHTKDVEDIKIGDKLMGDDSTPRNVLSLARGREQMYRIKYFDDSFYDVNENHILSLVASQSHVSQKMGDITNVVLRDYLQWSERKRRTNIGYKRAINLSPVLQKIDPYLLGLWVGDGNSSGGVITNPDKEICNFLELLGAKNVSKVKCPQWRIYGFSEKLREIGVLNNKHIPNEYLYGSITQRLELLAGLLDTDGYLDKNGTTFEIMQKKENLARSIQFLARSVGCHATLKAVKKTCTNAPGGPKTGTYWRVNISRNIWNIPTRISRKRAKKPLNPQRENLHYGFKVEKLKVDNYYGFELDGNNLFLLGDFTVTHNTGKSCTSSWLILWFLFTHYESQVACTSPGQQQLYDVLWKEIKRMPLGFGNNFIWESSHIRMKDAPEVWFARAKTASKENTEALAGVHADWVMIIVDEASGVEEPIFETMEGALTSGNVVVFLVGNGTRSNGYFYDTHHKDQNRWQNYQFSSLDSPRVDAKYVQGIVDKYGSDSTQYAIRVCGNFPEEGLTDDKGYVQLFSEKDLHFVPYDHLWIPVGRAICGLDTSGEGQDSTQWAIRDRQRAAIVASEQKSTSAGMANKTVTLCDKFNVDPIDTVIDAFGVGHSVAQEIALITSGNTKKFAWRVSPVNVGDQCDDEYDKELYVNKRAEAFHKMMLWARAGGEFMESPRLKDELFSIRYKRTLSGRIQIMDKQSMSKLGYSSPNMADALSLTFLRKDGIKINDSVQNTMVNTDFDAFAPVGQV